MFARLKVRARLMLVGRRGRTLFFTCLFAFARLFSLAAAAAFAGAFWLLLSQKSQWDRGGQQNYFVFACVALPVFCLILLYAFAWFTRARGLYFESLIAARHAPERETPFVEELRATLKTLLAALTVFALKALWLLFFSAPALFIGGFLLLRLRGGGIAANVCYALALASACLLVFGVLFYFCAAQRYLLAVRIAGRHSGGIRAAIRESVRLLDGSSAAVAAFKLSLAAGLLPCLWLFPAFFLIPYSRLSFELLCEKYLSAGTPAASADLNLFSTKRLPNI